MTAAALQLRIEERARRAQQAQLQREQLPVDRLVRLHDVLGVQAPAFRVGGVEGVQRPRQAHALLDHGIELQLVPGTRLVRGQRPGDGVEGEVVVLVALAAAGRRYVQRQHELAALAGVVQERRRHHVRRRLLRGLGRGSQADDGRPARQGHELVLGDDVLDRVQPLVEERQDCLARNLLLLQLADHVAVVADG